MAVTDEQRAELERLGWLKEVGDAKLELWVKKRSVASCYRNGYFSFTGDASDALEFTAIAGGYRLVPERLADRAAMEIEALAHVHATNGFKRDAAELEALASALQGEGVEKQ